MLAVSQGCHQLLEAAHGSLPHGLPQYGLLTAQSEGEGRCGEGEGGGERGREEEREQKSLRVTEQEGHLRDPKQGHFLKYQPKRNFEDLTHTIQCVYLYRLKYNNI